MTEKVTSVDRQVETSSRRTVILQKMGSDLLEIPEENLDAGDPNFDELSEAYDKLKGAFESAITAEIDVSLSRVIKALVVTMRGNEDGEDHEYGNNY